MIRTLATAAAIAALLGPAAAASDRAGRPEAPKPAIWTAADGLPLRAAPAPSLAPVIEVDDDDDDDDEGYRGWRGHFAPDPWAYGPRGYGHGYDYDHGHGDGAGYGRGYRAGPPPGYRERRRVAIRHGAYLGHAPRAVIAGLERRGVRVLEIDRDDDEIEIEGRFRGREIEIEVDRRSGRIVEVEFDD